MDIKKGKDSPFLGEITIMASPPIYIYCLGEGGDYAILNYTQKCFTFAFVPPFLVPAQDITLDSETGWTKDF